MECCQSMQHCYYSAVRYDVQMEFLLDMLIIIWLYLHCEDLYLMELHEDHINPIVYLVSACVLSDSSIIDSIFSKMYFKRASVFQSYLVIKSI